MNENIIKALMRLFAIVADVDREGRSVNERDIIKEFLGRQFSKELINKFIEDFDHELQSFHSSLDIESHEGKERQISEGIRKIHDICSQINVELEQPQKIVILIYLLDYINSDLNVTPTELFFVTAISDHLKISQDEFNDLKAFTFEKPDEVIHQDRILYIDSDKQFTDPYTKHHFIEGIDGRISVLHCKSSNIMAFRYEGSSLIYLNGMQIKNKRSYIWSQGSALKSQKFGSIYFGKIYTKFIQDTVDTKFVFTARDVEYSYKNSPHGVRPFNINENSGQLIGIIGGSGCGKSTLLNLLNGNLKPYKGSVRINGWDIHNPENKKLLQGVIGYVPQEEFLIKELTVWKNLYYNAKLCFQDYTEERIHKVIDDALVNFDLVEARDLRVGDEEKTFLSGGQRKRLNIAMELMREPAVLFVDEPTSGLSSMDSEKVMNLLKRQTFKGRMVFTILHQPSSDIFKLLDKLMVMDQGGRVVYYGNPAEAVIHFKRMANFADAEESECLRCGNINTELILKIIEARIVDVNGRLTRKRKVKPDEWYSYYLERFDPLIKRIHRPNDYSVPSSKFEKPSRFEQFKVYARRDIKAKLANSQYMLLTALEAPLLALILAFFSKQYTDIGASKIYLFSENTNLPAYLFMCVIVSIFLGLVVSAEEIFKDRKLLQRESFLHLSRSSYLNAKIVILFGISAFQTLGLVLVGNYILEIHDMTFRYWLILFASACWANMVGLNISSGFNSVVTIYILIPLILVPQLLFSGVVVDFNTMHRKISSEKYIPLIGDFMTSRWVYEGLMVTQFRDNKFEKEFFEYDKDISNLIYYKSYHIPKLLDYLTENIQNTNNSNIENIDLVVNECKNYLPGYSKVLNKPIKDLLKNPRDPEQVKGLYNALVAVQKDINNKYKILVINKESKLKWFINQQGSFDKVIKLKQNYYNKQLADIVLNNKDLTTIKEAKGHLIRIKDPIYKLPQAHYFRAHYYASLKRMGDVYIDTFIFNIIVIWLFTLFLYMTLYFDILKKIIRYFNIQELNRFNRRILQVLSPFQFESRY